MVRTRRGLKKAQSEKRQIRKESNFSYIVRKQKNLCWYCGVHMGTDVTKEHLVPQKMGGTDTWPRNNLVAADSACNLIVGHLPVDIKRKLRDMCLTKGIDVMFREARRLRRAQARDAFMDGSDRRRIR